MKVLGPCWRKLTASRALVEAGPVEKMFFETVYRLAFITGLSYSEEGAWYRIYSAFVYGVTLLVIVLEAWYSCSDGLTLEQIISAINVLLIHLITCWKLITMLSNKKIYRKVAKALDSANCDISTFKRKQLLICWTKTHSRYLTILLGVSAVTMFFWNTFPLIDDVEYNLMDRMRLPYKYETTVRYIITYLITGVMFNIASYLVIMSEVIMQAYLLPLICQYSILTDCFENIFEDCATDFQDLDKKKLINDVKFISKYKKRLGGLVKQHLVILNQTMDLKGILSAPLLGQLCGSGVLICFTGYQATQTISENPGKFMMTLGYLGYNMYALYLICRWCEEITSQSHYIGEAIYCSGWEDGISYIPGVKATIMIVICRANKPLIFDAGGMYKIGLSSYSDLVKASYSALNILLRMSND